MSFCFPEEEIVYEGCRVYGGFIAIVQNKL